MRASQLIVRMCLGPAAAACFDFSTAHPLLLSCYGNIAPYRNRASLSMAAGGTAIPTIPNAIMLVLLDSDGFALPHPRLSGGPTLEAALTLKYG